MLKLRAERCPAAEAGHPRDAGVVQLGRQAVTVISALDRDRYPPGCSSAANSSSSAAHTSGPFGCSTAALASLSGVESTRQPPDLCRAPGGLIWPPREDIGAGSITGNRSDMARARSRSSRQGSERREEDEHVAAAARRHVGDVPGAEPLEQLAELGAPGGSTSPRAGSRSSASMPPGGRAGIVDRHRARLARRIGGQRPGPPRRVGAAAVRRDPDVRRTGDRGRDRTPSGLRGGAREAVRTCRIVSRTRSACRHAGNVDLARWPVMVATVVGFLFGIRDVAAKQSPDLNERYAVVVGWPP